MNNQKILKSNLTAIALQEREFANSVFINEKLCSRGIYRTASILVLGMLFHYPLKIKRENVLIVCPLYNYGLYFS